MANYVFVTQWVIPAPLDRVWEALHRVERWPEWWRGLVRLTTLQAGDAQGVGAVHRLAWKGALPYILDMEMTTVAIDHHRTVDLRAKGELEGRGLWTLTQQGSATAVRYDWQVQTNKFWMNLLAPVARPIFAWNHDVIMRWGEQGLTQLLNTTGRS